MNHWSSLITSFNFKTSSSSLQISSSCMNKDEYDSVQVTRRFRRRRAAMTSSRQKKRRRYNNPLFSLSHHHSSSSSQNSNHHLQRLFSIPIGVRTKCSTLPDLSSYLPPSCRPFSLFSFPNLLFINLL